MSAIADQHGVFYERYQLMFSIKSYIISLLIVSVISGIFAAFSDKKGNSSPLIKMILGLFVLITAISPWSKVRFDHISNAIGDTKHDTKSAVYDGLKYSEESIRSGISTRTEAYILDKAESLGLDLKVRVYLADASPYAPESVEISGDASAYNKIRIQKIIADDIGILEECQIWI